MARRSLNIPNVEHTAPIPMGSRIGNLVFSSGIMGANPATGQIPDDPGQQAEFAFQNLRTFLQVAGATTDQIGRITVYVKDNKYREFINKPWIEMFPDEASRPARHAVETNLARNMLIQLEIVAVVE